MSVLGPVTRTYLFRRFAVLVFGWHEPVPGDSEQGVRVEVRLVRDTGHRGSPSAAQEVAIDQPLFRADLFELISGPPDNFLRAHYHPSFDGVEPCDRHWDPMLGTDPFRWLSEQLSDLDAIVARAGAATLVDRGALAADGAALRALGPEIVAAAERVSAQVRATRPA